MYVKTKALVISQLKYSDTSLVVTMYTELFGRQSFILQGVFKKKTKFPPVFFQPLTLLEIETSLSPKQQLQRIKEASIVHPFQTIPFDPVKNAITLFLSEILYKTLREEEANPAMFKYLENSIELFDRIGSGTANFHLWFLINLTRHLGFYPIDNFNQHNTIFDLQNGRFYEPMLAKTTETDIMLAKWINQLLNVTPGTLTNIVLNHSERNIITKNLIEYYHIHLGNIGNIKSLQVLKGVFL